MAKTPEQQAALDAARAKKAAGGNVADAGMRAPAGGVPPEAPVPQTPSTQPGGPVVDPKRPNWTYGGGGAGGAAPPGPPPVMDAPRALPAPEPGTAVMDPKRPNWTYGGNPPGAQTVVGQGAQPMRDNTAAVDIDSRVPRAAEAPGMRQGASVVGPAVRSLGASTVGALAAGVVNGARQDALEAEQKASPFVAPAQVPGQIPIDPNMKAPPAMAGSVMNQNEFTRNLNNTVMALPGISGLARAGTMGVNLVNQAAQAGVRGAPVVARVLNSPALPVATAAATGYMAGDMALPGKPRGDAPTSSAGATVAAPDQMVGPTRPSGKDLSNYLAGGGDGRGFNPVAGTGGGPNRVLPRDLSMLQDGAVYKTIDPTTGRVVYSGRNVKENAQILNADHKATGQLTNFPGSNNFIQVHDKDGKAVAPANFGASDAAIGMRAGDAGARTFNSSTRAGPVSDIRQWSSTIGGGDFDSQISALRRAAADRGDWEALALSYGDKTDAFGPIPTGPKWSHAGAKTLSQDANERFNRQQAEGALSPRRRAMMQHELAKQAASDAAALERTQVQAKTSRYGTDVQAEVAREGNQLSRENNQLQRQALLQQREFDRAMRIQDLGMRERTFQAEQEARTLQQKAAREQSVLEKIRARNTTTGSDGKPVVDENRVRAYNEAFNRAVGRLGAKGVHELSPADEEKLLAATDLLQRVQSEAGKLFWKPDVLRTVDPLDLTNLERDPKTGDYVINSPSNPKVHQQVIPARFLQTEEALHFPLGGWRGSPTNRFDMLVRPEQPKPQGARQ